ncbi:peptide ABC transporter ATP-binding protein [Xaviernesmea oryzae]|uniref:Peptide ABC transporter ATP-binding protein n=1 Tax=Xaviernesmea oryzae TaxID=464029 RepID=A0A1Q9AW42_9HYPH|nr:ABC transporter ATP-binding protein [Xaviernesmea oryzae]OLP59633.1 peptide ABC transporter ATP-binding protein [Xaviernesmea oryzae]SEM24426.1 peptide/nickel transport system ATP-binding protein [Xaviernesmea oryzae]
MTDAAFFAPLLEVRNLSLQYRSPGGPIPILHDISLYLKQGEVVGIIGESGAGKSTLGNAILGLLPPAFEQSDGTICISGMDLDRIDSRQGEALRRRRISAVFQDHTTSLDPLMSVGAQIAETIRAAEPTLCSEDVYRRVVALLKQVEIDDAERRFRDRPHQFSGGQRQRIVIAMALAGSPDLIVADEPTSALDATVQKQILALLRHLVEETGISILLVTHDMGVIAEIADRVVVMRHGHIAEQNAVSVVLDQPQNDYTRRLLAAVPKIRLTGDSVDTSVADTISVPALAIGGHGITKTFPLGRSVLPLMNSRRKAALQDISFDLLPGAITGVVGESGSGKSTLGRIFAGLEQADAGTIRIGEEIVDASRSSRKTGLLGRVQMIFQDPSVSLNPRMTIEKALRESVRYGARATGNGSGSLGAMMDRVGLSRSLLARYPHQLSGGQKQRVAIARALLARPQIIVADEPTSALDVSVQAEILDLLKEIVAEQNVTVLFISHDLAVVQALCRFVYVLKAGQIADSGSSDFIFTRSQSPYTRSLIDARPRRFTH